MDNLMLEYLLNQYKESIGNSTLSIKDLKDKNIKQEFITWLSIRKIKYGYRFIDILYEMNQKLLDRSSAEVDKCDFDSLFSPFDTTLISLYNLDDIDDRERIISAKLMVYDENPILLFEKGMMTLPRERLDTFINYNPYTPYSIKNWGDLHNSGFFNIAVGVFGNINDKDKDKKIKLLVDLKNTIVDNDYYYDIDTDNYMYYGALVSKEKRLIKK